MTYKPPICIGQVRGQETAKLGLVLASIGGHNILLVGPPGEGKSFICSTMQGFMPPLYGGHINELEYIYEDTNLPTPSLRPFIEVSPNITPAALLGGGHKPTPGAISLANRGILFMDEFPEYDKGMLESLRGPMESGDIVVTRKGITKVYDCAFQLIAAMNPCPCGYFPSDTCTCSANKVARYQGKLSGPMLDRIDMVISMQKLSAVDKFKPPVFNQTGIFYIKVLEALTHSTEVRSQVIRNAYIPGHETFDPSSRYYRWTNDALLLFKRIVDLPMFSSRKAVRLSRLSRSVSDLQKEEEISVRSLRIAYSYMHTGSVVM